MPGPPKVDYSMEFRRAKQRRTDFFIVLLSEANMMSNCKIKSIIDSAAPFVRNTVVWIETGENSND